MRSVYWTALLLLAVMTTGRAVHLGANGEPPAAEAAAQGQPSATRPHGEATLNEKWPGFRGQDRDGVYHQLIRVNWDGLAPMWKKPIGGGRASFAVAGGRAFTIEQRQRSEVVAAYDVMTG